MFYPRLWTDLWTAAMTTLAAILVLLLAVLFAPTTGVLRIAVGVLMVAITVALGLRGLRKYRSIPPEPDLADVGDYGLKYVCTMCGLELKIEVAAHDKPPTHCHEPMVLVRTGGKPPLRPV